MAYVTNATGDAKSAQIEKIHKTIANFCFVFSVFSYLCKTYPEFFN